jgi:hypothetical protein
MSNKGEQTKLAKSALFLIAGQSIVFAGNLLVGSAGQSSHGDNWFARCIWFAGIAFLFHSEIAT